MEEPSMVRPPTSLFRPLAELRATNLQASRVGHCYRESQQTHTPFLSQGVCLVRRICH